jgi:hypothetical protein
MSKRSDENVKVCVRVRPLSNKELSGGTRICLNADSTNNAILLDSKPESKIFNFDYVAPDTITQVNYSNQANGPLI